MNEKFIRSFVAGVIGGIIKDTVDFIFYYLFHFGNYRYVDFAAEVIYGNKPKFWWDTTFAQFIELIFCGFLGVLFYTLIPEETKKNSLIKGWLYGVAIWLFLCIMGMVYKIPFFSKIPWPTANSDFITSSVYGITLAWVLRFLDQKYQTSP